MKRETMYRRSKGEDFFVSETRVVTVVSETRVVTVVTMGSVSGWGPQF